MRLLSRPWESNRQSSTRVAWPEKSAKLTPLPSQLAPRGYGEPSRTSAGSFRSGAFMGPRAETVVVVSRHLATWKIQNARREPAGWSWRGRKATRARDGHDPAK